MSKYANSRLHVRTATGRFRQPTMADAGIGGVCPNCRHFLIHHYDGDPHTNPPDPRRFRYRCFTCEPLTADELALQAEMDAAQPQQASILEVLAAFANQAAA